MIASNHPEATAANPSRGHAATAHHRGDLQATLAVILGLAALYLFMASGGITFDDSPALTVAAWHFGVPHPPGFPVWTTLAGSFAHLFPFGSIAARLVFLSTAATALACGLITWSVTRAARHFLSAQATPSPNPPGLAAFPRVGGIAAGLILGLTQAACFQSGRIDVHALTLFLFASVLTLSLEAITHPRRAGLVPAAALALGLALTNDHRLVLAIPAIQLLWILADPRRGRDLLLINVALAVALSWFVRHESLAAATLSGPILIGIQAWGIASFLGSLWLAWHTRAIGTCLHRALIPFLACLLGLLPFLLLPLRSFSNPPMDWGFTRTWSGYLLHLTRAQYPGPMVTLDWSTAHALLGRAIQELGPVAFTAALLTVMAVRRPGFHRQLASSLLLAALSLTILPTLLYRPQFDPANWAETSSLYLPAWTVFATLAGLGAASLLTRLDAESASLRPLALLAVLSGGVWSIAFASPQPVHSTDQFLRLVPVLGLLIAAVARDIWPPVRILLASYAVVASLILQGFLNRTPATRTAGSAAPELAHSLLAPPGLEPLPLHAVLVTGTDFTRFAAEYLVHCENPLAHPDAPRRTDIAVVAAPALSNPEYLASLRTRYSPSAQTNVGLFQSRLDPEYMVRTNAIPMPPGIAGRIDAHLLVHANDQDRRRRVPVPAVQPADLPDPAALVLRIRSGTRPVDASLREALSSLPDSPDATSLADALTTLMEDEAWYDPERFPDESTPENFRLLGLQNPVGPSRTRLNRLLLSSAYPEQVLPPAPGLYPVLELNIPREDDRRYRVAAYFADARSRAESGKLLEGENVTRLSDGTFSIGGPAALATINGQLVRFLVQLNPGRPFYLDASVTFPWIESRILPYGPLFRLHPDPITNLPPTAIEADRAFWSGTTRTLLGHAFDLPLSVEQLTRMAADWEANGPKDPTTSQARFHADPQGRATFARLRLGSAQAFYLPRSRTATNTVHRQQLLEGTELALQQAFLLDPSSIPATRALARFLIDQDRTDNARSFLADRLRRRPDIAELQSLLDLAPLLPRP